LKNKMQKTKIEWCDYTINPVKGLCPMACDYCYARRMYKRFKWNFEIRYDQTVFFGLPYKSARVFVGSTIELFGDWVKPEWLETIFTICRQHNEHIFIFLTKQPQNLNKWSPFPENCWVGVSAIDYRHATDGCRWLDNVQAKTKFLSIEPLLSWGESINTSAAENWFSDLGWLIIGAQTPYNKKTAPKLSWVQEILVAASNAGNIPVFMKNNLQPVIDHDSLWAGWKLRQEFPK